MENVFAVRKIQCDNGSEFPLAFRLAVEAAGIRHRYIKPRRPQQNEKVERSHRIDSEEFWGRHEFTDRVDAEPQLREWERRYNHERFSLAIAGRTAAEKLAASIRTSSSSLSVLGLRSRPDGQRGGGRSVTEFWGPILTTSHKPSPRTPRRT